MANVAIKKFNFFRRYRWTHLDFADFQQAGLDTVHGLFEGMVGSAAVLSGFTRGTPTGLSLSVGTGIAFSSSAGLLATTTTNVTVVSDPANPVKHLVVARRLSEDSTLITDPLNPVATVYLHALQKAQVVVIQGTPGGSPVYPAKQAGDVILFGVSLTTAQAGALAASIDTSVTEVGTLDASLAAHKADQKKHVEEFDAIVGSASYCTHSTLAAAITAVAAGSRILVVSNLALAAPVVVGKAGLEIVFKNAATVSNSGAGTGLSVTAANVTVRGGVFSGFTTQAIEVTSGGTGLMLRDLRFTGNTEDIGDSDDLASVVGCI